MNVFSKNVSIVSQLSQKHLRYTTVCYANLYNAKQLKTSVGSIVVEWGIIKNINKLDQFRTSERTEKRSHVRFLGKLSIIAY